MGWGGQTESSTFDAGSYSTNVMNTRSASRSGASVNSNYGYQSATGWGGFLGVGHAEVTGVDAQSFGGYSVVGISAAQIPAMRNKIAEEVEKIQTYLDGIGMASSDENGTSAPVGTNEDGEQVDARTAIKGDQMVNALNSYITSVKAYAKALVSNLLAFSDKLQEVSNKWNSSSENFATNNIKASTASMAENSAYYQEQFERTDNTQSSTGGSTATPPGTNNGSANPNNATLQ